MIEPCCVVSKLSTVFLLLTALTGFIQAKIHRCLREFDPSNCNALEEVWAFDARGQNCTEMVYGGCGKPQKFSNRFESHEQCMLSCKNVVKGSSKQVERAAEEDKDDEKDDAGDEPQFDLKTREFKSGRAPSRKHKGDEIRGVSSVNSREIDQLQANVPQTKLPQLDSSNGKLTLVSRNTMGIDRYNYRVRPHYRSLGPIGEFRSPAYAPAPYPVGHIIMYGPLGNIIQPTMQFYAPMNGQGLEWDSSLSTYNIPSTALTGAYPFLQSVPGLPGQPVKK